MRKNLNLTALLIFAATAFGQDKFVDTTRIYSPENYRNKFAAGEFIVAFKSGTTDFADPNLSALIHVHNRRNLAQAKRPHSRNLAFADRKLVLMVSGDTTHDGSLTNLNRLRQDPNVAYVEPNYILHAVIVPNDSAFSLQWAMQNTGQLGGTPHADIDATDAWNRTQGNPNMLIGVIDTGIDYLHPDLAGNIWTNPGEIANNGIDDDGNGFVDDVHGFNFVNNTGDPMDDNNHGTHVAGIIAAMGNNGIGVSGVVWKAKLVALKFLDSTGNGTVAAAIDALTYANAMGITLTNNSWAGGGFSQAMKDVIDAAGAKGYLFIAAAGNGTNNNGVPNNNDATPTYPASYTSSNLISVAATDFNDALASFSNYGSTSVDLGAPGVDIYSTKPGNSYQYLSGTSMATPHVSGAAALLWSYNPTLTSAQVKSYLLQGVDSVSSLKGKVASAGRLNLNKALNLAMPPILSYKNTTISAIKNVAIPQDTAVSLGGVIVSYAMNPSTPLPTGLSLNGTTGILSGVPKAVSTAMNDTVVATGPNGTGKTVITVAVVDTAPAISYKHALIAAVKNVTIVSDTVLSVGGGVTSYAMSPSTPLPAGLMLNSNTGTLSGIPLLVSAAANDTIIATGPGGAGKAVVNIAVTDTAPAISYKRVTITAVKDVAIIPDTAIPTGGAITNYAVSNSTPLPAGLVLNSNTGILSGTPTAVSAAINDTIVATGPGGAGKAVLDISVTDTTPALSYKRASIAAVKNVLLVPDTAISLGGAITTYSVSSSTPLPAGLTLSTTTGILSGTPTTVTPALNDTIMATGPGGTGRTVINIAVADTAPKIAYKRAVLSTIRNTTLFPDTVVSTGGAITSFAISPFTPLPAGLTLSTITGVLSGTSTAVSAAINDTITATGPGGTGKTVVNISVTDTAPAIFYKYATIAATKNVSITPDTAVSKGGGIATFAMSAFTPLVAGLTLNGSTGTLSGIPTAVSTAVNDTIIASGPGGIGKAVVNITVNMVVSILDPYVVHAPGVNPFSFQVPEGSTRVRLIVEDVRGRIVLSQNLRVGEGGLVSWNGRDANGRTVPSGVYMVHLKLLDAAENIQNSAQVKPGILSP